MGCCSSCLRGSDYEQIPDDCHLPTTSDRSDSSGRSLSTQASLAAPHARTVKNLDSSFQAVSTGQDDDAHDKNCVRNHVVSNGNLLNGSRGDDNQGFNGSRNMEEGASSSSSKPTSAGKSRRGTTLSVISSGEPHHQQSVSSYSQQAVQSSIAKSQSPPRTFTLQMQETIGSLTSTLTDTVSNLSTTATSMLRSVSTGSGNNENESTAHHNKHHHSHLPIVAGMVVLLKFMIENKFESRFIWVDLKKKTMHMSQHMTKEKRHKEVRGDMLTWGTCNC
jgi:hypothetical protein